MNHKLDNILFVLAPILNSTMKELDKSKEVQGMIIVFDNEEVTFISTTNDKEYIKEKLVTILYTLENVSIEKLDNKVN